MTVALEVAALTHRFGDLQVLDNVSFSCERGSITAVLGPSGGGKTTLLRLIAGFERAASGSIHIAGRQVTGARHFVPPQHRGVGFVPQEGALFPHLSVERNISFGLEERRGSEARARVAELLEMIGMTGMESRDPSELSGGMQQRVALARALAAHPDLVLLDEPFSALDAGLRESVRDQVVNVLRATGATAVLVTHDQDEALSIADSVVVLQQGRAAQVGHPQQVYGSPVSLMVATFVGEATRLEGTVLSDCVTVDCPVGSLSITKASQPGPVTVAVRPEQLEIGPEGQGSPGTVTNSRYFGHDGTVVVSLDSGSTVTVRLHARLLPDPGARVGVRVIGEPAVFPR